MLSVALCFHHRVHYLLSTCRSECNHSLRSRYVV